MATPLAILLICLLAAARAVVIEPVLQALSWKYNNADFWAPVHVESSAYYAQSPAGALPSALTRRDLQPGSYIGCTVLTIPSNAESLSADVVNEVLAGFADDDVWSAEQFRDCLFVQGPEGAEEIPVDASFADFLEGHSVTTAFVSTAFILEGAAAGVSPLESSCSFPNGPYVVTVPTCDDDGLGMTPVYSLHADQYQAFMHGSIRDSSEPDRYQQLHVSLPGSDKPHIIVPSRLSSTDAGAGPLAGLRFGVKDIFHVKGLKTSGGSRSYYQTYGYQNHTTETVQLTLDAGASMVGKTRTIAFALGAPLNGMEVDYQDPWNARGDGYQSTEGSSTGSGAAVTAYEWVDFAIGSDTGGSVRLPARAGGIYGYKPTHGIFNLTGILPAITEQDTPGFLARSPEIFTRVGRVWTDDKVLAPAPASLPGKLLRQVDSVSPITQPDAEALVDSFFANVAEALKLGTETVNVTERFIAANISKSDPPEAMPKFMETVYSDQNAVQGWDAIGAPLAEAYGAFPPADPPVNVSWTAGQNATVRTRYPESQQRREAFAGWFNGAVLRSGRETCSEFIFARSLHEAPDMDKVEPVAAELTGGWLDTMMMNYAGTPEVVVPIGQVQYWSPYTQRLEWQPVTVAFAAARGCDLLLFDLVDRLAELGLVKEVMAGKVAYPVDE